MSRALLDKWGAAEYISAGGYPRSRQFRKFSLTESSASRSEYVYRAWKIRIDITPVESTFSATVDIWKPDHEPRSHSGIIVPFRKRAASPADALAAALETAENWIDAEMG
jgi:hypothetical protein